MTAAPHEFHFVVQPGLVVGIGAAFLAIGLLFLVFRRAIVRWGERHPPSNWYANAGIPGVAGAIVAGVVLLVIGVGFLALGLYGLVAHVPVSPYR